MVDWKRILIFGALFLLSSRDVALAATCVQPCGSPTSGSTVRPKASDALTVLRAAVGQRTTCYSCECDVVGKGNGIGAADALAVLRKAVGIAAAFSCPACTAVSAANADERGRIALERHDLARADVEFSCAIDADPSDDIEGAANLFGAIVHVLHYAAADPDAADLLASFGGTGDLDFYDFSADIPGGADAPPAVDIRDVVLGSFDDALSLALERLGVAKANTTFSAKLTSAMLPSGLRGSRSSYEMDATDAAVLSAVFHLVRLTTRLGVGIYHDSTFDEMVLDWTQLCDAGFLTSNPSFATVVGNTARQVAREEMEAALEDFVLALNLVDAEIDAQGNDLLVRDDLPSDQYSRNEKSVVEALLSSMMGLTPLETCDAEPLSVRFGRLLENPLNRTDFPEFDGSAGRCRADRDTFPDLTFNGVFNRAVPITEIEAMASDWYPVCR